MSGTPCALTFSRSCGPSTGLHLDNTCTRIAGSARVAVTWQERYNVRGQDIHLVMSSLGEVMAGTSAHTLCENTPQVRKEGLCEFTHEAPSIS
jgi:hypothetical protein